MPQLTTPPPFYTLDNKPCTIILTTLYALPTLAMVPGTLSESDRALLTPNVAA